MNKVDFLPETIRAKHERRIRIVREGYLLIAMVGCIALLGTVRQGWIRQAEAQLAQVETRADNSQLQLEHRKNLQRMEADLMIRRRIMEDLGSRANALDVMSELEIVTPRTIVLKDIRLETMLVKVPVTEANQNTATQIIGSNKAAKFTIERRLRLTVTGLSPTDVDVANFIAQMSASSCFEDVNMGYARNVEYHRRRAREFQASCYLVR